MLVHILQCHKEFALLFYYCISFKDLSIFYEDIKHITLYHLSLSFFFFFSPFWWNLEQFHWSNGIPGFTGWGSDLVCLFSSYTITWILVKYCPYLVFFLTQLYIWKDREFIIPDASMSVTRSLIQCSTDCLWIEAEGVNYFACQDPL